MYPWIKYEACAATSLVSSKTCQTTEWINWDEASEYYLNLVDECGTDMTNSCWMNGNRWSIIYILCAISMLLLAVNAGLMVLGACSHHARATHFLRRYGTVLLPDLHQLLCSWHLIQYQHNANLHTVLPLIIQILTL